MRDYRGLGWVARVVTFVLLFAAIASFTIYRIADPDIWWHLAAGRVIALTHAVPRTDTLSYTAIGRPWIDLQWLFDVAAFAIHSAAGPAGLTALVTAAIVVTFGVLFSIARRDGFIPAVIAVGVSAVAASERFAPRPELGTFVLFASVLWILETSEPRWRRIWWLIPLQMVWVNVHALFIVGLVLIWSYAIGRLLLALHAGSSTTRRTARRLCLAAVAATVACIVNPYGFRGFTFPFVLLTRFTSHQAVYASIGEFMSPFTVPPMPTIRAYELLLGLSAICAVLSWRSRRFDRIIAWAAFLSLSVLARRNMGLFALASVPSVAAGLHSMADAIRRRSTMLQAHRGIETLIALALSCSVSALTIYAVVTNRYYWYSNQRLEFGIGVSEIDLPLRAARFLDDAGIHGRVFNDMQVGGYLAWAGRPVFLDGRLEVYDEQFFAAYRHLLEAPAEFAGIADRYGIDTVLLFHIWPNREPLIEQLTHDARWALVYVDEAAVVFVRNVPANVSIGELGVQRTQAHLAELRVAPDDTSHPPLRRPVQAPYARLQVANALALIGQPQLAAQQYEAALRLRPDFLDARLGLGYARWMLGDRAAARDAWRQALRLDHTFEPARTALQLADQQR